MMRRMIRLPPIARPPIAAWFALCFLASCQTEPPSFLAQSEQDCRQGDQLACRMLIDLRGPQPALGQVQPVRPPPTQAQRDAAAILEGMRRARANPSTGED